MESNRSPLRMSRRVGLLAAVDFVEEAAERLRLAVVAAEMQVGYHDGIEHGSGRLSGVAVSRTILRCIVRMRR